MALWTPATSGAPATALWFDANLSSTITQSGGSVSQWNDRSGNANHAVQATGSLQPTYDATAAGGKGAIVFGGGGSQKLFDITSTLTTGTAWTAFVVAKMTAQTLQAYIFGGSNYGAYVGGNVPADFGVYNGINFRQKTFATNPTIYNAAHVLEYAPATLWTDGTAVSSYESGSATLTNSMSLTRLGSRPDQTTLYFIGELYELIWVPSTLAQSDRELFEGYLAWKWGLDGLLPSGHPYKSAAPTDGTGGTSASFAVTDRPDAAAINALLAVQASMDVTDRPDAAAINATLSNQAQLAVTDRPDAAAVTADLALPPSVSFAVTDRPDSAAINVLGAQLANLATTEPPDALAATVNFSVTFSAALAVTDLPDAAAINALAAAQAQLAATDRPDALAASISLTTPLTAALAVTDRPDVLVVNTGLAGIMAVSMDATDLPDTAHACAWTYPWNDLTDPGGVWTDIHPGHPC
jgi:hypothetical protein